MQEVRPIYRIGEFSKITYLSVRTLRYYDEQGLLSPSGRSESGYRLYCEEDFLRAERIKLLRSFDFSIAEIRDVLSHCETNEDLSYYLSEKCVQISDNIRRQKKLITAMNRLISSTHREEYHMTAYSIERRDIPEQLVALIHYHGTYTDCGRYIGTLYKEAKNKACGAPIHYFYDAEYTEQADMDICVPISAPVTCRKSTVQHLPSVNALTTMHIGSYDTLNFAYKALLDYAREHHLEPCTPTRLVYHKGPGALFRGNPEKYATEVIIPVRPAK